MTYFGPPTTYVLNPEGKMVEVAVPKLIGCRDRHPDVSFDLVIAAALNPEIDKALPTAEPLIAHVPLAEQVELAQQPGM